MEAYHDRWRGDRRLTDHDHNRDRIAYVRLVLSWVCPLDSRGSTLHPSMYHTAFAHVFTIRVIISRPETTPQIRLTASYRRLNVESLSPIVQSLTPLHWHSTVAPVYST